MLPTLKNKAAAGYQGPVKIAFEGCRPMVKQREWMGGRVGLG